MAYYVIEYRYVPGLENLVESFRPAHRTHLRLLESEGQLIASGFLHDSSFNGALLILRAPSAKQAAALLDDDPFITNGLVEDLRVREWVPTLGSHAKTFDVHFPVC